MSVNDFEDICRGIRQRLPKPVYFLQGDEPFFIDEITELLSTCLLEPAEQSFNQTIFDGKDVDVDTVRSAAMRYPLMAERQVIIVKEAQHLRDIEKLLSYVQKPVSTTVLAFTYKGKSLNANSKLAKAIAQNGIFFASKKLYENQVPAWVSGWLKKQGFSIEPNASSLVVEYLGNELSRITNELSKLLIGLPPKATITHNLIADNIGISKEFNVFELQKALATRNTHKVFLIADYFAANLKNNPLVVVVASLYRFFAKLLVFHTVARKPEAEILAAMDMSSKYFLSDYQTAAKQFTAPQTVQAIEALYLADLHSKGVNNPNTDDAEILREMLIRILA